MRRIPVRKDNRGKDVDLESILAAFESGPLAQLKQALDAKDRDGFERIYKESLTVCYSCHKAADKPYLRPQVPAEPGDPDPELRPKGRLATLTRTPASLRDDRRRPPTPSYSLPRRRV